MKMEVMEHLLPINISVFLVGKFFEFSFKCGSAKDILLAEMELQKLQGMIKNILSQIATVEPSEKKTMFNGKPKRQSKNPSTSISIDPTNKPTSEFNFPTKFPTVIDPTSKIFVDQAGKVNLLELEKGTDKNLTPEQIQKRREKNARRNVRKKENRAKNLAEERVSAMASNTSEILRRDDVIIDLKTKLEEVVIAKEYAESNSKKLAQELRDAKHEATKLAQELRGAKQVATTWKTTNDKLIKTFWFERKIQEAFINKVKEECGNETDKLNLKIKSLEDDIVSLEKNVDLSKISSTKVEEQSRIVEALLPFAFNYYFRNRDAPFTFLSDFGYSRDSILAWLFYNVPGLLSQSSIFDDWMSKRKAYRRRGKAKHYYQLLVMASTTTPGEFFLKPAIFSEQSAVR